MRLNSRQKRLLLIASFSTMFTYLLSFLFEGVILHALLQKYRAESFLYISVPIGAHFLGLFFGGIGIKGIGQAKRRIILSASLCLIVSIAFFLPPTKLWIFWLMICGGALGCSVAAWGYFLKYWIAREERLKICADLLIVSNVLMILINLVTVHISFQMGFTLAMAFLGIGIILSAQIPLSPGRISALEEEAGEYPKNPRDLRKTLGVLFLFISIITINSGLMYQVFNPAFQHLAGLASWYWALPYVGILIIIRKHIAETKRSILLYAGMAMMILSFLGFMFMDRSAFSYLIIDTLMLGACGIFDLFWWSILGEMLEYTDEPARVFGLGLSANVFGVFLGGLLSKGAETWSFSEAHIAVLALMAVCITLALLPFLNRQLILLLKYHAWQLSYGLDQKIIDQHEKEKKIISRLKVPLTDREEQILQLMLEGKNNEEVAETLFISVNTVKTHVRRIFSKYQVETRAQLISFFLDE